VRTGTLAYYERTVRCKALPRSMRSKAVRNWGWFDAMRSNSRSAASMEAPPPPPLPPPLLVLLGPPRATPPPPPQCSGAS